MLRGGYRMTYDRIGSQLAVTFDLNTSLGFTAAPGVSANTFNVSDRLAPLFAGANPQVRALLLAQGIAVPGSIAFPLTEPADEDQRIQQSLDDTLTTPYNHSVNFSYGRDIGHGFSIEGVMWGASPGICWRRATSCSLTIFAIHSRIPRYQASNRLVDLRYAGAAIQSVPSIPFFENLFPGLAGVYTNLLTGQPYTLTATQAAYRRFALPRWVDETRLITHSHNCFGTISP